MTSDLAVQRARRVYESDRPRLWRSLDAFTGSRSIGDDAAAHAVAQVLRRGDDVVDVAAWVWRSAFAIARGELQRRGRSTGEPRDPSPATSSHPTVYPATVSRPTTAIDLTR